MTSDQALKQVQKAEEHINNAYNEMWESSHYLGEIALSVAKNTMLFGALGLIGVSLIGWLVSMINVVVGVLMIIGGIGLAIYVIVQCNKAIKLLKVSYDRYIKSLYEDKNI